MYKIVMIVCFVAMCCTAKGQISLASPFTDNMVLQQKTEVQIWGWGAPSEEIKISGSWSSSDTVSVIVNDMGCWSTKIATVKAGGPYTLTVLGMDRVELKNVMLGEVWLCSGQSNMEWTHNQGLNNSEKEIAQANHPNIRIYHIPRRGSETLQNSCDAQWTECNSNTMASTSAVAYFFARELTEKMDVPVGIVVSSWAGTPANVWVPENVITSHPYLNSVKHGKSPYFPNQTAVAYNQMINPLVPYTLAGAIWYQGESDTGERASLGYGLLMKRLIESWRGAFNNSELPFYFVQIAPFSGYSTTPFAAILREQQELVVSQVPQTGMVVINDLVEDINDVHPRNKLDVGVRLANMAMAKTYDLPIKSYQSPTYKSVVFKRDKAYVSFDNILTEIEVRGKTIVGFMIADTSGVFVPAKAILNDGVVIVSAKGIKTPTAVRYCFDSATIGNLFTKEGLPFAPFRTDSRSSMLK